MTPLLQTERLLLRRFFPEDVPALFLLLQDEEVNTFLPWFALKDMQEAETFYRERIAPEYEKPQARFYAVCLREDNVPIGYITVGAEESRDLGYALRRQFWHRGIMTEAGIEVLKELERAGIPYVTATHDVKNPKSGGVMRRLGLKYQYSYVEQWQPKDIPVTFRMYQRNLDGDPHHVFLKYWQTYPVHFIEKEL